MYYIEHGMHRSLVYIEWAEWLEEHVGNNGSQWKWDDFAGMFFICFAKEEDATAFKLKFNV